MIIHSSAYIVWSTPLKRHAFGNALIVALEPYLVVHHLACIINRDIVIRTGQCIRYVLGLLSRNSTYQSLTGRFGKYDRIASCGKLPTA